jgi:transcriptional regulator with XRE-family HTH domain
MTNTLASKLKSLPIARRKKINKRAKELIEEEMTLRELRKTLELTQAEMSNKLHMKQEAISRLERRSDLLLSTLISYIEAMGGKLNITAKFPNRPAIKVTGFDEIDKKAS